MIIELERRKRFSIRQNGRMLGLTPSTLRPKRMKSRRKMRDGTATSRE